MNVSREEIERIKENYPVGTRVVMNHCADIYLPIKTGVKGTVCVVDDLGTIHVDWDNGRKLGVILGEDSISIIDEN